MPHRAYRMVRFEGFELDLRAGELCRPGEKAVRVPEQPFRILVMLLEKPGDVVNREEIRNSLWPNGTVVEFEHSISAAMNRLRQLLGDSAESPRYVETLARRGYRWKIPVQWVESPVEAASPAAAGERSGQARVATATAYIPPLPAVTSKQRRRWAGFALILLVLLSGTVFLAWRRFRPRAQPPPGRVMLAVLPFQNLTGDPGQEYFSDGLTEEMITALGGMQPKRLGVIARTSVMQYKHTDKLVGQIGQELGVQYLLEGSVRRDAGRVRISAQLIQVGDQTHLWAGNYQRDLRDILAIQNEVAEAIAGEIQLRLTIPEKTRLASVRGVDPEAHEAYLRGRYFWNQRTAQGMGESVPYFQKAIDLDPKYAVAYAGLAEAYVLLGGFSIPKDEAMPKAKAAAKKALELDDSIAEAHNALALIAENNDWNWQEADREYRRAIQLNPNYATAHHWYGQGFLAIMGRFDEAKQEMKKARELDPLSLSIRTDAASVFYYSREYDQATAQLINTLAIDPNFMPAHAFLAMVYEQTRNFDQAIAEWQAALRLDGSPRVRYGLGRAYGLGAKRKEALQVLAELQSESKRTYVAPWCVAQVYLGLGNRDQAFAWLEKAYQERSADLDSMKVGAYYDPLRSDPRFSDLLRRLGLPQ